MSLLILFTFINSSTCQAATRRRHADKFLLRRPRIPIASVFSKNTRNQATTRSTSGVSLAIGLRPAPPEPSGKPPQALGGVMGSLRVIELQLVAFIMVFSASGLVPVLDLAFPAVATLYIVALSRLAFPGAASRGDELFRGGRAFRAYVAAGATVGLFLPLAYVLGAFARGDDHALRAATPHLFLLSCQILTENVICGTGACSPPVRAMVPLLYTVRRVFLLLDWIDAIWFSDKLSADQSIKDAAWIWVGRSLAIANLFYFSVNLFGFLIPRFLPWAFEKYFKERGEVIAKTVEDKLATETAEPLPPPSKSKDSKKAD